MFESIFEITLKIIKISTKCKKFIHDVSQWDIKQWGRFLRRNGSIKADGESIL